MKAKRSLCSVRPGERAVICELRTEGSMRRRLLDIGLVPGTQVVCLGRSPCGDPTAYMIRGAVIAIRKKDCRNILISSSEEG